jgi:hypothetical protein
MAVQARLKLPKPVTAAIAPRPAWRQGGAERSDSQVVMTDQRRLRRFDTRRGNHARLAGHHPGIEQQEIERPASLDQPAKSGPNAGRRVQLQFKRREDVALGFRRQLRGGFLDPGQVAASDDDLAPALFGKSAA